MLEQIKELLIDRSFYYIKQEHVVEKIEFNSRTFYAKFQRVNKPLSDTVIIRHLEKKITVASTLLIDNKTQSLVIVYKGENAQKFSHITKQLFHAIDIKDYHFYQGKSEKYLQVFIPTKQLYLQEAYIKLQEISRYLELKMPTEWQILPNPNLPESYNIFTLPYKIYS